MPGAEELSRFVDERAIVEVTHRYCAALDGRDWAALARCFTPDAVATYGRVPGRHEGLPAIERVCRQALEPLDVSQHLVASHLVDISGDAARSRCYVRAQHTRRGLDGGENFMVAGTYEDEWRRTPQGWRITSRTLVVTWTEGNPAVLARRPAQGSEARGEAGAAGPGEEPR
jgi:ketosteroid isomerase-like protein